MKVNNQANGTQESRASLVNRLLAVLPEPESDELLARLEPVELALGQVLSEPFEPITHTYFPEDAMISLLSLTGDGDPVEIAIIGNEGLVGAAALLGKDNLPYRAMVIGPGRALRIELLALEDLSARHPPLQGLILRYLHALLTQIAQTAVCNRYHSTEQRLAHWLLVSQDRLQSDAFPWTREFLAHMLGAEQTSVTAAVGNLKKAGLIRQARGRVTILNREGLIRSSCECYRIVKAEFDQVSGQ
ncbi:MAG TPA: Crp/Fnr family transcriptional regulator [Blastocatellia bacterium]|nr:Crp/Fnr family transcriptional regulator [Blastocatellia bacterium]